MPGFSSFFPLLCSLQQSLSFVQVTLDIEAVYTREGDAPLTALREALAAAAGAADDGGQLAGLRSALSGVVWTRSMRRMFTLVDRYDAKTFCYRCVLQTYCGACINLQLL